MHTASTTRHAQHVEIDAAYDTPFYDEHCLLGGRKRKAMWFRSSILTSDAMLDHSIKKFVLLASA